jgi:hypothetical protein
MAPRAIPDSLLTAYRDAGVRLRGLEADATKRVQDAMSATPGWQAASKAAAAHAVLVASRYETELLTSELLRAHIDAGERSPEAVAEQMRRGFLAELSAPGLGFFEGSAAEAAALKPAELRHASDFESWRDALAASVADRFRRALEDHEAQAQSPVARARRPGLPENRMILGLLLVTAVMSLCGVSWLGLVQKALALF